MGMVVALAAVFAPAAGAQLPSVNVPSVSTPTVSTSVQVPSIKVPQTPVQTPQVQVPSAQLPHVQTPQLHVQAPQAPQVPGVNTPSVPGTGSVPSVGAAPGATTPSGAAGRAASGFGLAADGSPVAGNGAFAPTSPGQARAVSRRAQRRQRVQRRHRAVRAREARLRDSARRLRGCLDALPNFDRRVIVLRAGIGGAPHTRRQVAERLDVSVGRVRHAERSGVRSLRRANSDFGCGSVPGGTTGSTGTGVGLAVSSVGIFQPDLDTRLASNTPAADRNEVAGETRSSDDSGAFDPGKIVRQVAGAEPGESNLLLVVLLGLSVIALMAVELLRSRSRRAAAGVPGEAPWAAALKKDPPAERQTAQRGTTDPVSAAAAQKVFAEHAPEQRTKPGTGEPAAPPNEGNGTASRAGSATAGGIGDVAKRIRARLKR